jgi:hypothetical protein
MDSLDLTPDEEAEFGNLSDHDMMDPVEKEIVDKLALISQAIAQQVHILAALQQSISALAEGVARPKKTTLVRDQSGRASHSITEPI